MPAMMRMGSPGAMWIRKKFSTMAISTVSSPVVMRLSK